MPEILFSDQEKRGITHPAKRKKTKRRRK